MKPKFINKRPIVYITSLIETNKNMHLLPIVFKSWQRIPRITKFRDSCMIYQVDLTPRVSHSHVCNTGWRQENNKAACPSGFRVQSCFLIVFFSHRKGPLVIKLWKQTGYLFKASWEKIGFHIPVCNSIFQKIYFFKSFSTFLVLMMWEGRGEAPFLWCWA